MFDEKITNAVFSVKEQGISNKHIKRDIFECLAEMKTNIEKEKREIGFSIRIIDNIKYISIDRISIQCERLHNMAEQTKHTEGLLKIVGSIDLLNDQAGYDGFYNLFPLATALSEKYFPAIN